MLVNSRSDLEGLRGTPEFENVLQALYGSMTTWALAEGQWQPTENLTAIERLGFTKQQFLAEIEPFDFPDPIAPDLPVEPLWEALRAQRDGLIAETDWLVQRHTEELALDIATTLTPEQYTDLLTYRQALRDLPEGTLDPADPVWPVNPLGEP